jgi:hypothetical protein
MRGGTALIDQPFTVRQGVDSADRFFKDPAGAFGFGAKKRRMRGGTALIDQPFTVRQGVDSADRFFKDPAGAFGFGVMDDARRMVQTVEKYGGTPFGFGHPRRGGALIQAGY